MPFLGSVHFPLPQSQGGLLGRWQVASGICPPNPTPPTPRWLTLLQTLDLPGRGWGCREALPQPPPGKCT